MLDNQAQFDGRQPAPGAGIAPASVYVWDLAVRLFHWSLAGTVLTAWWTGGSGGVIHEILGYAALALVVFRLMWGLGGTRHARFRDFVRSPRAVLGYLAGIATHRAPRYVGHNPAGGMMILVLLGMILLVGITGWLQMTVHFFGVIWLEELHHWAANALIACVAMHVLGVIVSSWMHQENLVGAMLGGHKRPPVADDVGILPSPEASLLDRVKSNEGVILLALTLFVGAGYGVYATRGREAVLIPTSAEIAVKAGSPAVVATRAVAAAIAAPAMPEPAKSTPVPPAAVRSAAAAPVPPAAVPAAAAPAAMSPPRIVAAARDPQDFVTGGPEDPTDPWMLASGGRLYDNWFVSLAKPGPATPHPSWPRENTTRPAADTWRCVACHGWDYQGRDGQFRSGPNATGFVGIQRAKGRSAESIIDILGNRTHQYSDELLPQHAKFRLAQFIARGQHTVDMYLQPTGQIKGDVERGRQLFQTVCAACHGFDGRARRLGLSTDPTWPGKPLFVGTKARGNPQEVLHKLRNGHPGAIMISLRALPIEQSASVLAYLRTLPAD